VSLAVLLLLVVVEGVVLRTPGVLCRHTACSSTSTEGSGAPEKGEL
jgi:hypothetical protein